jgi:hypothetical protein
MWAPAQAEPLPGGNEMPKEQPIKELERIRDAMSEAITKLKNDEITIEEANAFTKKCAESMARIEKELKKRK